MAIKANLVIDQGTTFSTDFALTDDYGNKLQLSGYTVTAQMRKWYSSINATATFTTGIDVANAVVTIGLSANQTGNITAGRYVYDVKLSDSLSSSRLVEGIVTVTPQASI